MLQQTRVDAAIPYYERWLARFPTLTALAEAPLDDVLHAWQGLGYYSRARNLHRAARLVRERHGGRVPDDAAELRALPGVGDYTAGAIASIAYGHARPAVDGNVRRVLARLLDEPAPTAALLRHAAGSLVPADRPGDFNQAVMELGATVCTPRAPRCGRCPVRELCLAYARGTQLERPAPKKRAAVPSFDVGTAVVVDEEGRVLLVRRPETGLLAGMWEFPGRAGAGAGAGGGQRGGERGGMDLLGWTEAVRGAAVRAAEEALAAAGGRLDPAGAAGEALGSIDHAFSHRRECYHAFRFRARAGGGSSAASGVTAAWYTAEALADIAMPAAQRRIAAL
jgi:A/G-specific adenine glycosylase